MAWTRHEKVVALADESTEQIGDFRTHLEFLGYTTEVHDDGWVSATSPVRPDFFARQLPFGVRLLAKFHLGCLDKPLLTRWLAYVNDQNNDSLLVTLAVHVDGGEANWAVHDSAVRMERRSLPTARVASLPQALSAAYPGRQWLESRRSDVQTERPSFRLLPIPFPAKNQTASRR